MADMSYTKRWAAQVLAEALSFQRSAVVVGARQCGKTTLVRHEMPVPSQYVTLDNDTTLKSAVEDPAYFVKTAKEKCLVIDEIQKAPRLISEIKMRIDEDNRIAQYVMTGSADYRKLPQTTDSLAGRSIFIRLRGMTEAEAQGKPPAFLKKAFDRDFPGLGECAPCSKKDLFELVLKGGYPQARTMPANARWRYFESYAQAQIQHDLAENWNLNRFRALQTLLEYAGIYSSKLLNVQELCSRLGTTRQTINNYLMALEAMYIIDRLPPWLHKDYDIGSKTPKLFMADTGLMAYLLNIRHAGELLPDSYQPDIADISGKLVETWVYNQLAAEIDLYPGWRISHLRNKNKQEIDFMVEGGRNKLIGIEVKSAESVSTEDFRHLKWFAKHAKHPFTGIVLYAGNQIGSFGDGCYALPYSALWA